MKGNFSVAVMAIVPEGIVLVMDPLKPEPYWKFPGGHGWDSESSQEAATRELEEETGIAINPYELELLLREKRRNRDNDGCHDFFLFYVFLPRSPELKNRGNEGEMIKVFPISFISDPNFFPNHRQAIMSSIEA